MGDKEVPVFYLINWIAAYVSLGSEVWFHLIFLAAALAAYERLVLGIFR